MTATLTGTATYTDAGHLSITAADGTKILVGDHDADGGEWEAAVDAMLAGSGWTRTGAWDGDNAPVSRG